MAPAATIPEIADKLLVMLRLGSRGPVILIGERYASFDAAAMLAQEVERAGSSFSAVLLRPGRQKGRELDSARGQVVFLHGLELLGIELMEQRLKTLNRRRDEFRQQAGLTIIWLPENLVGSFMRHCPDVFAWRSFLEQVHVAVPDERRSRLELAACITRSDTAADSAGRPVLTPFAPASNGETEPPRALQWVLESHDRAWLTASDFPAAVATVWSLAREQAWQWLEDIDEDRGLLVPLHLLSQPHDLRSDLAASCLGPHAQRLQDWLREGWITIVVVLEPEQPVSLDISRLQDEVAGRCMAVLSRLAPGRMPPGFRRFDAVGDLTFENRRRLLLAGLSEDELARIDALGVLALPSENTMRLMAAHERDDGLPEDDLGLLEVLLGGDRERLPALHVLDELAASSAVPTAALSPESARQLMLAARALTGSNWADLLMETGLLARPQATNALRIALERRLRTHGIDDWLFDLESLADSVSDSVELATLLTAALGASRSLRGQQAPEQLRRRAESHLAELAELESPIAEGNEGGASELRRSFSMLKAALEQAQAPARPRTVAPRQTLDTRETGTRMNTAAKRALSSTIRSLRARLLDDLHAATESAYRLSVRARDAGLDEATRARRRRLEAWVTEQARAQRAGKGKDKDNRSPEAFRREVEKQAAYTLLNRLVMLRLMEAPGPSGEPLRSPAVVTGGWESRAYQSFREIAQGLVRGDETEGYAFLLQLVFEDLATELPGLYGPAGIADLIPIPASTLRHVVDALNVPELESCWTDDMTLGWVYQYWNDPEREALDAKLNSGGKVEPHEIASKTQMFTERYMVDWLLQNSLGPMWLAMCKKHGWTPEVEADGTLDALEARRAEWRAKREAPPEQGGVELTDLMPLHTGAERRWAYYVPQPIPDDAVAQAPDSVRDIKLIDPAVGSGHFLVVALDLLVALYREEARHRGEMDDEQWSDRAIVERILGHNLHGIDLDPRAVQIAAAALWLKARQVAPEARPERINLVASNLRLASLPDNDPALVELRREVARETGIPGALTDTLVHALRGADHLGSLLKIDRAVDEALDRHEAELGQVAPEQGGLFTGFAKKRKRKAMGRDQARATLLDRIEGFLRKHTSGDDLGLRLRGAQLAAGVRFVRMVREGAYDLVVANPPYQGTGKMADSKYIENVYELGKSDLYAAFLLRGLELVREGGVSSMLTMRNWMFLTQYAGLREHLLGTYDLRALGDFDRGAFEDVPDEIVSVAVSSFVRAAHCTESVALCPTLREDRSRDNARTPRKRAATLCHVGRHTFDPAALKVVPEWPLVYWWPGPRLSVFARFRALATQFEFLAGLKTGNDVRFVRVSWELPPLHETKLDSTDSPLLVDAHRDLANWSYYIMGAAGEVWFEPARRAVRWRHLALELRTFGMYVAPGTVRVRNFDGYFRGGVAFSMIGSTFLARAHRFPSVFGSKGSSIVGESHSSIVCALNRSESRTMVQDLNPSISFTLGDVGKLPFRPETAVGSIWALIEAAFTLHEARREPSVEFKHPGPSPWRHAQDWAQAAVDRPEGAPLPEYVEELDPEPPTDHLSFALGVALGRFGKDGEGILDPATAELGHALPHGILFLDTTLDAGDHRDSLGHPAAAPLHAAWAEHGPAIGTKRGLRDWLALDFFKDVHKGMYENRPIHWPLSSSGKTFVAWVNIHRFTEQTLRVLLADHLMPTLTRLEGELNDLRAARDGADKKAARAAEKRFDRVLRAKDELQAFVAGVSQCADRGAPPTDSKCPAREQDARYAPDLDDGVMINAAGLWPLLDPQWKDPKKWWKELATAKGRKDYDWSHLAMRYWPTRVDEKCQQDPSLGVAHGCFWRYHPARAWAWELRLQDEIGPGFRIEEAPYCPGGRDLGDAGDGPHRDAWLRDHAGEALAAIEKEATRRMGRGKDRKRVSEMRILEAGLWTAHAADIWDMELRLSEKQGSEFRLLAPDEPEARAAFEAQHPEKVRARQRSLASLVPAPALFEDGEEDAPEEEEDDDDAPSDHEEDES